MSRWSNIVLSTDKVALEPLTEEHIQALTEVNSDADIWKWFSADLSGDDDMISWMHDRLSESDQGSKISFAVRDLSTNKIAGTTSYGHIEWDEHVIEIGWTWLGKSFFGSGINKHMKFLMLSHAFEEMEIERVEIRTDEINARSRRAIEKIGAELDGILRSHRITIGGRRRNTAVYAIIKKDWPGIRKSIFKEF